MYDDGLQILQGLETTFDDATRATPWTLLVVDDEEQVHAVTQLALDGLSFEGRPLRMLSAYSAAEAMALLQTKTNVAVVLLDMVMETDTAGLSLVRWIRNGIGNTDIRIILRTGHPAHAQDRRIILTYDINDYRSKAEMTSDRVFSTVIAALRSYKQITAHGKRLAALRKAHRATAFALAEVAERRDADPHASALSYRVHDLSQAIAERLREGGHHTATLTRDFLADIGLASSLRDVGKMFVPDHILCKPGRLSPAEWDIMKRHTETGCAILSRTARALTGLTYLSMAATVARHHHERFDGSGYPDGLSGHDIPLEARITAVTDVYDALLSERFHKPAWPLHVAVATMRDARGSHFDPIVFDAFLDCLNDGPAHDAGVL